MGIADISKSFFIIIVFVSMIIFSVFALGIQKLKDDWPKNKCNPAYMPFASMVDVDPMENFNQCMAEIQESLMDTFLGPVNASIATLGEVAQGTINATDSLRNTGAGLLDMIPSMQFQMFNILEEFVIYLKKFVLNLTSTMQKVMALATVFMHYIVGFKYTGQSLWCGTVGNTLRSMQLPGPFREKERDELRKKAGLCEDDDDD